MNIALGSASIWQASASGLHEDLEVLIGFLICLESIDEGQLILAYIAKIHILYIPILSCDRKN